MLPLFDNKMSLIGEIDLGRNDQIYRDTIYMQKLEVSNICVCLSSHYSVSFINKAYKRFKLTSDRASRISLESHRKLFSYNFGKTVS